MNPPPAIQIPAPTMQPANSVTPLTGSFFDELKPTPTPPPAGLVPPPVVPSAAPEEPKTEPKPEAKTEPPPAAPAAEEEPDLLDDSKWETYQSKLTPKALEDAKGFRLRYKEVRRIEDQNKERAHKLRELQTKASAKDKELAEKEATLTTQIGKAEASGNDERVNRLTAQLAEVESRREELNKKFTEADRERRQALLVTNITRSPDYIEQVQQPKIKAAESLRVFAEAYSEDPDTQQEVMQRVAQASAVKDYATRRKILNEIDGLTAADAGEIGRILQIADRADEAEGQLLKDSEATATRMKEGEMAQIKSHHAAQKGSYDNARNEARVEIAKKLPVFSDIEKLPENFKRLALEAREMADKMDWRLAGPAELGAITEGFFHQQAALHMAGESLRLRDERIQALESASTTELTELKAKLAEAEAKVSALTAARPTLGDGSSGGTPTDPMAGVSSFSEAFARMRA